MATRSKAYRLAHRLRNAHRRNLREPPNGWPVVSEGTRKRILGAMATPAPPWATGAKTRAVGFGPWRFDGWTAPARRAGQEER